MATKQYELQLASGAVHAIPTTEEYRGNAENGELAARGFQFFESAPGTPEAPDRAVHRQVYDQLLGSTPEDQV
jgi:type VI secretion system secreted protein VgrG